jgi:hypothetical protein
MEFFEQMKIYLARSETKIKIKDITCAFQVQLFVELFLDQFLQRSYNLSYHLVFVFAIAGRRKF